LIDAASGPRCGEIDLDHRADGSERGRESEIGPVWTRFLIARLRFRDPVRLDASVENIDKHFAAPFRRWRTSAPPYRLQSLNGGPDGPPTRMVGARGLTPTLAT
jgi:hypothetical protein